MSHNESKLFRVNQNEVKNQNDSIRLRMRRTHQKFSKRIETHHKRSEHVRMNQNKSKSMIMNQNESKLPE